MKAFMDDNYLLTNDTAVTLYHEYAKEEPIYDFHNHLNVKELFEDKKFSSITEAWLGFDHYKWRAMRDLGIDEKFITGDASDKEKFDAWASAVPKLIGNPLYSWTHLELQRYFDIYEPLTPETADEIYDKINQLLAQDAYSARNLLLKLKVTKMCTTDDPADNLEYHIGLAKEGFEIDVYPSFRPDNALHIQKPAFVPYIAKLRDTFGGKLDTVEELVDLLIERLDFFVENGCRLADHGLDEMLYEPTTSEAVNTIYQKVLTGDAPTKSEQGQFLGFVLTRLGRAYHKHNMVMCLHIGPMRNNATRLFEKKGADIGLDSINDGRVAVPLSRFLDALDVDDKLPKTVLFNLNPNDNAVLATMTGNFQGSTAYGKIQFGTAWWFNDHKEGMVQQMIDFANKGALATSVGMLTDSRSFLSFPRHELYRRILCNLFGEWVENGEYPAHIETLGSIVKDICYRNAEKYI